MTQKISPTCLLLSIPFLLTGPVMALMPRMMMIWIVLVALTLLPTLRAHWQDIRQRIDREGLLVLLLTLFYAAISTLWSPSPKAYLAVMDVGYLSLCCSVIFLALPHMEEKTQRILLRLFMAGCALGFGLLLAECFFDHPFTRWYNHMPADEKIGENVPKRMAAIFALAIWPFALWLKARGWKILSIFSVIAFTGVSVFLTNRSSLLGMVVGMAVMCFAFYQAALARWALMALLCLGLFFVVPVSIFLPLIPQDVTGQLFDSAQQRIAIWTKTAEHVLEAPLQGHGIDASKGLVTEMDGNQAFYQAGAQVISQHPHNIFLQIWLDFGFAGAVLWGILLLMLVDRIRFLHATAQPYVLGAVYCSLMMLNTTFSIMNAWWLAGHMTVAVLLMLQSYNLSRNAETSGTSAGGMA